MSKLFKTRNFIIIEGVILLLVFFGISLELFPTRLLGDCTPGFYKELIPPYWHISCSELFNLAGYIILGPLFIIYLLIFIINKLILRDEKQKIYGFWDFTNQKIYKNKREKLYDFLFGFFGLIVGIFGIIPFLLAVGEVTNEFAVNEVLDKFMGAALFIIILFSVYYISLIYIAAKLKKRFSLLRKFIAIGIGFAFPLVFLFGFILYIIVNLAGVRWG